MAHPLVSSDALWERIEPLLPPVKRRRFHHPGRKPIAVRFPRVDGAIRMSVSLAWKQAGKIGKKARTGRARWMVPFDAILAAWLRAAGGVKCYHLLSFLAATDYGIIGSRGRDHSQQGEST
jgi:hypothetical protein